MTSGGSGGGGDSIDDDKLFVIKHNEYGNMSAYAATFIPKHTLIHYEYPVICGQDIETLTLYHDDLKHQCQADDDAYLMEELGLDEKTCDSIWKLHDQYINTYASNYHPLSSPNEKRIVGIIKSNAHHSNDEGGRGLYITMRPNLGFGFDGWQMRLYSTCDIPAGDELCKCYTDTVYFFNRLERAEYLKNKFNFDCICNGCKIIDHVSDTRRERLRFLAQRLSQRSRLAIKRSDLDMILECIEIMKVESLEHNVCETYRLALDWAMELGEYDNITGVRNEELLLGVEERYNILSSISTEYFKLIELSKGETIQSNAKLTTK